MSQQEIDLHEQLLRELKEGTSPTRFLAALHRFAQLSQHPSLLSGDGEDQDVADLVAHSSKLKAVIHLLHSILGRREKAIIFARHRAMQSILSKVFSAEFNVNVRIINRETKARASGGASAARTRSAILEEFKTKPGFNVLVLSPFVAGIGLTITEANHVIHYGRWWNAAVESQATDRTYRIGQTKDLFVHLPILHDPSGRVPVTFDQRLDALMESKHRLAQDFLRPLAPEDEIGGELIAAMQNEQAQQEGHA
jgi:SNF2 family DNA or RNA helicase